MAHRYHYPAIDILGSVSRLAPDVSSKAEVRAAGVVRRHMAVYAEAEDLINVGAYHAGSNPVIDAAIAKHAAVEEFLMQGVEEKCSLADTIQRLGEIAEVPIPEAGAAAPSEEISVPAL
jgi:flagellum-specific ATP synthase